MDKKPGIRPRLTVWHQLDTAARYAFPLGLTASGLLALSAPMGLPGQAELQPAWVLACVFFWSLFRPASLPAFGVFLLGLLLDLLSQAPIGTGMLIMLLSQAAVLRARRVLARQGFAVVWLVFVGASAAAATAQWLLVALLTWRALPPWPALFQAGLAAGIYPLLAPLLTRAHRGIAAPELA